jgi:hypothetical protein
MADDAALTFQQRVAPVLKAHCVDCHSGDKPAAQLRLNEAPDQPQLLSNHLQWFRVLEQVEYGAMPPKDATPLSPRDRETLRMWVRDDLTQLVITRQKSEGRSSLRRLSRVEYANTVQDIFGIRPPVMRTMPGDGRVDGFEKASKALPFSAAVTDSHLKIAEATVERMLSHPQDQRTIKLWSQDSGQSKGHLLELPENWWVSFNSDTHSGALVAETTGGQRNGFPSPRKPGWHRLRMHVYGYQTDKPLPVGIYAGHVWAYPQMLELLDVIDVPPGKPTIIETEVYLRTTQDSDLPSAHGLRLIPFGLGVPVPKNSLASERGKGKPGLAVQWVEVIELEGTLPGQELLFGSLSEPMRAAINSNKTLKASGLSRSEIEADVRRSFARIGARLFRRDLSAAELTAVVTLYLQAVDAGSSLKEPFVAEVVRLLTAPDFVCVLEQPGLLDDFALASRLAYFLWNSTPDEELMSVARAGKLRDSAVLRAQTERLLGDRKSERFIKDFLDQWLGLWGIDNTTPDKDLYPEYDDELKIASVRETRATFRRMLNENRSIRDFVAPDWAMLNGRLARHYGVPDVEGFELRPVTLPADSPFGGLWTQAATMKVTANGTLTSPVKRGVWVAERLLGVRIPAPPANIEPIDPDTRGAKTLREQLALHRAHTSCAGCHAKFDGYGYALESFDVMGNFRSKYRIAGSGKEQKWQEGLPVDSSGLTPDGKAFASIKELRAMLVQHPEQLARGVTRHLVTYATGEATSPVDQARMDAIVTAAAKDQYGLRSLLHGVVQSELFRSK